MPLLATVIVCLAIMQSPAQQPSSDAVARAHAVLASIAANDFAQVEARFTEAMTAALPSGNLAARWTALQKQAGAFKTCGKDSRVRPIADKVMVITPCEFERATIDVQFAFDRSGRISGLAFRPSAGLASAYTLPSYANPSAYSEKETTIGSSEWVLPATLSVPVGASRVPAVVLVHGSGPHDRDETVGAKKPFMDLATGLASRGIAVLRYEKRTKAFAAKVAAQSQFSVEQEGIEDALEAVKTLRADSSVDPSRVFHSAPGVTSHSAAIPA